MERKRFDFPDETRYFDKGKAEIVHVGNVTFGKYTLEPGWKWSESVKPTVGTEWCEVPHTQVLLSGRMHLVMEDGSEFDLGPGDVQFIPPGHDGWVVGDEPAVMLDVTGAEQYASR